MDWKSATFLMCEHRLAPRFYRILSKNKNAAKIPRASLENLFQAALFSNQMHALYGWYLPRLLQDFTQLNVDAVFLKGLLLAQRIYDVPEDRIFTDFDLLFRPEEKSKVENYFRSHGFDESTEKKWEANSHKTEFSLRTDPRIKVECHYGLGHGAYAFKSLTFEKDAPAGLCRLTPEDEYLYLVFHAGVQHRFQKLIWVQDLCLFRKAYPRLSYTVLFDRARSLNLTAALEMSEYFVGKFFGLEGALKENNAAYDLWFSQIVLGEVERSNILKARLRSALQGGWFELGKSRLKRAGVMK